ncbi:MAG: GDSL-type esterase/lipase family protein [Flavobacteriaceae bacterium]|nr:GDSL-type esterase/lipase family protein [Flavobacteriaceae bacterium]
MNCLNTCKAFVVLITSFFMTEQTFGQDWAGLNRYKEENGILSSKDNNGKRVVFIGNSITEGWVNQNPAMFTEAYINRGIGSQTTPQILYRFQQDVVDLKPKVVVILAGTNDIAENSGPITQEEIMANIKAMAALAKKNHIAVVLCSVLPAFDYYWRPGLHPDKKIPELNKKLKAYAGEAGHIYVDYFSAIADERNGLPKSMLKMVYILRKKVTQ